MAFDVVVEPASQGTLGEIVQDGDIGDVGEADQASDVSEEALGGMSAGSNGGVGQGEIALTTFTLELRSVNDEFDGSVSQRKILDRIGVEPTVNRIAGMAAFGASGDLDIGNDG